MPRKRAENRGGRRQPTKGTQYGNRSDLRGGNVVRFPSTQYGSQAAQVAAQQAVPTGPNPASQAPGPAPAPAPAGAGPGELPDLFAPTDRPNEPMTAGMPFGPGPGPAAPPVAYDPAADQLRRIYQATQDPHLLAIIAELDQ